jgi:hypothetical protein
VYTKTTKEIGEYVGRTYRYGSDVQRAVQKLTMPNMPVPADPADGANKSVFRMWEKKIDEFVKRELSLEENLRTLYTLIWGQCTEIERARLEAFDGYERMSEDYDTLTLLKAIKSIAFNFQSTKYKPDALNDSKRRLYMLIQDKLMTCHIYLDRFQSCIDVIEHCGGSIGNEPAIVNEILISGLIDPDKASQGEIAAAITVAQEKCLASLFLQGADKGRFGKLIEDLEIAYTQGRDNYPKTVQDTYTLLTNWKDKNSTQTSVPTNDGVSFTNVDGHEGDEIVLNTNGGEPIKKGRKVKDQNAHPGITCHKCGIMGHYASDCAQDQDIRQTETQMLMYGVASGEFDDQEELKFSFYSESSCWKTEN